MAVAFMVLTMSWAVGGSPGRASAPRPPSGGIIEIRGNGGGAAHFSLARPATLLAFQNAFTRRPFFERHPDVAGETKGDYVGWYLQKLPEMTPIAGFLTIPALDGSMGRPLPLGLVSNWPETLAPGDYRVVLLADGPSRAFIRTAEPWAAQVLHASKPHAVAESDLVTWTSPTSSAVSPFDVVDPSTLIFEMGWSRTDVAGADQSVMCFTPRPDTTCALSGTVSQPAGGGGFFAGGPRSRSIGAWMRVLKPGEVAPGEYNHVLHGAGVQSSGGALAIGIADGGDPLAPSAGGG